MPNRFALKQRTPWLIAGGTVLAVVAVALVVWMWAGDEVTIGVEGRYEVTLPEQQLVAVPYTHGDPLAVRIASAVAVEDGGTRYDIRYMAYGPGDHNLSEYLVAGAGAPATELPEMVVTVDALLEDDYSGKLFETAQTPIDLNSNYRMAMTLLWVVWGLMLIPLALYGRKRHAQVITVPPPPSTAERLRHLLQLAEQGSLNVEQQADLEKLLLVYWAERLNVSAERLTDMLEQLRQHPTAGPQVLDVERWLHGRQNGFNGKVAQELLNQLGWQSSGSQGVPA